MHTVAPDRASAGSGVLAGSPDPVNSRVESAACGARGQACPLTTRSWRPGEHVRNSRTLEWQNCHARWPGRPGWAMAASWAFGP